MNNGIIKMWYEPLEQQPYDMFNNICNTKVTSYYF